MKEYFVKILEALSKMWENIEIIVDQPVENSSLMIDVIISGDIYNTELNFFERETFCFIFAERMEVPKQLASRTFFINTVEDMTQNILLVQVTFEGYKTYLASFRKQEELMQESALKQWDMLCRYSGASDEIKYQGVPFLICEDKIQKMNETFENNDGIEISYCDGGVHPSLEAGRYVIILGIEPSFSIDEEAEKILRHELIHCLLNLKGVNGYDNSIKFWCYCYAFDGDAYAPLSKEDQKFYDVFVQKYNEFQQLIEKKSHSRSTTIFTAPLFLIIDSIPDKIKKVIK